MMVLLIQKEVAVRICAKAGKMSLLSNSVQLYGIPKVISVVSKENFYPVPEVDSAIIKIEDIKTWGQAKRKDLNLSEKDFWRILKAGFSAKRKKLLNNLAGGLQLDRDIVKTVFSEAEIDEQIRAQNLEISDWFNVAKNLENHLN